MYYCNVKIKLQIQTTLLPIYLDPTESTTLRMSVFSILMDTKPSYGILQMIIHGLKTERSVNVGSYVYSYLIDIVETPRPGLDTV